MNYESGKGKVEQLQCKYFVKLGVTSVEMNGFKVW